MQKRIELDGAVCRFARNGDLFLIPRLRYPIYLLLSGTGLLSVLLWESGLKIIVFALLLVCLAVLLVLWLKQPQLRISAGRGMIEWRRWFHRRLFSFADVARLEVFFDHQIFDLMGHLVVHKISIAVTANLEIILIDGNRLFLGKISGDLAQDRALPCAETLAKVIGVPVSSARNVS